MNWRWLSLGETEGIRGNRDRDLRKMSCTQHHWSHYSDTDALSWKKSRKVIWILFPVIQSSPNLVLLGFYKLPYSFQYIPFMLDFAGEVSIVCNKNLSSTVSLYFSFSLKNIFIKPKLLLNQTFGFLSSYLLSLLNYWIFLYNFSCTSESRNINENSFWEKLSKDLSMFNFNKKLENLSINLIENRHNRNSINIILEIF